MKNDSAFYIGTTHKVCEDYAVNKNKIIVVSDGCSSSPNTDIGARIVCECAKEHSRTNWIKRNVIMYHAKQIISIMDVPKRALDVTLLTAFEKDDKIIVETIGDGNIIFKTKDGILHVVSMNYARSAPYYMNYISDKEDDFAWSNIPDNDYTIEYSTIKYNGKIDDDEDSYSIETHLNPDGGISVLNAILDCSFSFSEKGNNIELDKKNIEWIALSSDGLESFYEKVATETSLVNKSVWYIDVIIDLLKINNTNGKFVQRRLNKFRKTCAKKNWYNADDVSLAILVPGE